MTYHWSSYSGACFVASVASANPNLTDTPYAYAYMLASRVYIDYKSFNGLSYTQKRRVTV